MSKKIIINTDLCIGCGSCEAIAPEHFKLKTDGKSHIVEQYKDKDTDKIAEAVDSCPVDAIKIVKEKESK